LLWPVALPEEGEWLFELLPLPELLVPFVLALSAALDFYDLSPTLLRLAFFKLLWRSEARPLAPDF